MGRPGKKQWTQAKFDSYLKEGRGQGEREKYKPWLTVRDVSSRGRSSRVAGWKTGRDHHLLSDHETRLFYLFEWSDEIKDIREQFPLLNLDLAMKIANEIGWSYPRDTETDIPYILTTDFMLTVERDGKLFHVARTFKEAKELDTESVAARLELERRYYLAERIDWDVLTEKGYSKPLAQNVEWVHSSYWLELPLGISNENFRSLAKILKLRLHETELSINQITAALDAEHHLEDGSFLYIFKYLVARKEIMMNMLSTNISSCSSAKLIQRIVY
jgi:TnsA endonuclease N terminal/TnsA endonuclease C terminal